ncbi:MAG: sigma-70 family RNA polymerase sigma factor [Ruminococcaceae bacterium]|nr:sigma-70 family RNA polymerase sigma factor [Oscillospiraceae bacterium]
MVMFFSLLGSALQNLLFFALHFDNTNSFPRKLTRKEEEECIRAVANGDRSARDKLIQHNMRLVAFIVRRHYPDYRDQEDLISIGIIGLIRAAETFDYERSINFSTYAGKCINNQIRMHFRKIKHQQTEVYMNEPMDCDKDGNEVTMADMFPDDTCVEDEAFLNINIKKLYKYIDEELNEREKEILTKRYGLSGTGYKVQHIYTQQEVAEELNISRSYVSRIEKKALLKLKARFDEE